METGARSPYPRRYRNAAFGLNMQVRHDGKE
jgi:hypothetical protein